MVLRFVRIPMNTYELLGAPQGRLRLTQGGSYKYIYEYFDIFLPSDPQAGPDLPEVRTGSIYMLPSGGLESS